MDVLDTLVVRFRIKGEFVTEVREKKYVGGVEALSYIDRDKVSLGEILAHLREYYKVMEGTLLHCLFPGKNMQTGLRALMDDRVCNFMSDCIVEDGVAEIFVEEPEIVELCNNSYDDNDY